MGFEYRALTVPIDEAEQALNYFGKDGFQTDSTNVFGTDEGLFMSIVMHRLVEEAAPEPMGMRG